VGAQPWTQVSPTIKFNQTPRGPIQIKPSGINQTSLWAKNYSHLWKLNQAKEHNQNSKIFLNKKRLKNLSENTNQAKKA
jgi:hypothetical protein